MSDPSDITSDPLYSAFYGLTVPPREDQRAPIIAFTSPYSGSGTSYTARQVALLAAKFYLPHGFRVLLVDYDIDQQSQAVAFEDPAHQTRNGALSGPFDLTYGQEPFWQISPDVVDDLGNRIGAGAYCGSYLIGDTGLVITKFDWTKVKSGQNVHVTSQPDYWSVLRDHFAMIIIDTPAFDRGDTALDVCALADKTVIVSDSHRAQARAFSDLSTRIKSIGGQCAGMIVNNGAQTTHIKPQASASDAVKVTLT